jgi:hypothetical protein
MPGDEVKPSGSTSREARPAGSASPVAREKLEGTFARGPLVLPPTNGVG